MMSIPGVMRCSRLNFFFLPETVYSAQSSEWYAGTGEVSRAVRNPLPVPTNSKEKTSNKYSCTKMEKIEGEIKELWEGLYFPHLATRITQRYAKKLQTEQNYNAR